MTGRAQHAPTAEYFDGIRRFIECHGEHTWADEMHTAMYADALALIARGHPHPEALAQAALGTYLDDERREA